MSQTQSYEAVAEAIVEEQRELFGPQAVAVADGVAGMAVDDGDGVEIYGDGETVLGDLTREYVDVFGDSVARSLAAIANERAPSLDLPQVLQFEKRLEGFTEARSDGEWQCVSELSDVDPQPRVWTRLFGYGTRDRPATAFDVSPIAPNRGVPMDASETVIDAWVEQGADESAPRPATGHTWVRAEEIPESLLAEASEALVGALETVRGMGTDARLVVWFAFGD